MSASVWPPEDGGSGLRCQTRFAGTPKKEQFSILQPKIESALVMQSADLFLSGKNDVLERRIRRDASKRAEQVPCNADTACSDDEIDGYIAGIILQLAELAAQAGRGSVAKQLMLAYKMASEDRA